ncbi:MAG: ABC transporter permease, partial [Terriglobia bacterium]
MSRADWFDAMREWALRLWGTWRGTRTDQDLEQELRLHLELAEEELRHHGQSGPEAARKARVRFGNSTNAMEAMRAQRGIPHLSALWLDMKLGLRMLRKHWGLTLAGGLAMTLAITLGTAFWIFLEARTGATLPLAEGDRVVVVQPFNRASRSAQATAVEEFARWRSALRSLTQVSAFRTVERNLITADGPSGPVTIAEISASGFVVARVAPLMGRFLLADDEAANAPPVVVIGYNVWHSKFAASPQVVGRTVQLGGVGHTIVGVMPKDFAFPVNHQFWTPLRTNAQGEVTVFARLAAGAGMDIARAEAEAMGLSSPTIGRAGGQTRARVVPYIIGITGNSPGFLAQFMPVVIALLVAPPAINLAVLMYARVIARQGEFAVRTALGASRGRIVGQIFVELLLLALGSAGAALALTPTVSRFLSSMLVFIDRPFWMDFGFSYRTIFFAAGLAVIGALIAGGLPALVATGRWKRSGHFAYHRVSAPRLGVTWTAVVVAQIAMAVAIGPTVTEFTWVNVRPWIAGPGFKAEEYLNARLAMEAQTEPGAAAARFDLMRAEMVRLLKAEPGVTAVTMSESAPFEERDVRIEVGVANAGGTIETHRESVSFNQVDRAFFETLRLPLLAGRGFEAGDVGLGRSAIVVNRSLARRIAGNGNPLGHRVRVARDSGAAAQEYEIVGVVGELDTQSSIPVMYRQLSGAAQPGAGSELASAPAVRGGIRDQAIRLTVHAGTGIQDSIARRLREIAATIDPALRVDDIQTLGEIYKYSSMPDIAAGFGIAGLTLGVVLFALACIYTLMSFTVVRRRREIGIRSALGASRFRLVAGIFRSVLLPVSVGVALGGLAALPISHYLSP